MTRAKQVEQETKKRLLFEEEKLIINKKNVIERNKKASSLNNADKYEEDMNKCIPILENADRNIRLQIKYNNPD